MTALLALLLAVSILSGCSGGMATEVKNAAAAPPELLYEEAVRTEPVYTVEVEVLEDTILAEDGTELIRYRFETPRLSVLEDTLTAETQAVLAVFNEEFNDWTDSEGLAELTRAAEEELGWQREAGGEWYGPFELELVCDIYRTERMISVYGAYYRNTGGAHPNTYPMSWNYDLAAGTFFKADELATDSQDFQDEVRDEILRQANTPREDGTVPAEGYWEDYEDIAANWHNYTVTFDDLGMTVVFAPYELACYAAGPQRFYLAYEDLLPHLSDHGRSILGLEGTE